MMENITILTTHFYDFDWTKCLISKIRSNTDQKTIKEILIINQDRTYKSKVRLEKLDTKVRVLEYPKSLPHFKKQGHDHAYVLNKAIKEATGDYICIFDSDAHPYSKDWVTRCESILMDFDAISALDHHAFKQKSLTLTHPCFMVIKREHVSIPISFDQELFINNFDTGRLVGRQLENVGLKVFYAHPVKSFEGIWGSMYIDSIYHHERGSYRGGDERLRNQIDKRQNFFKHIVTKKNRYKFSKLEKQYYRLRFVRKGLLSSPLDSLRNTPKKINSWMKKHFIIR